MNNLKTRFELYFDVYFHCQSFFKDLITFMHMSVCLFVCMYTTCLLGIHEDQKKALYHLDLELEAIWNNTSPGPLQ